jgi:hypothetical protein
MISVFASSAADRGFQPINSVGVAT